MLLTLLSFSLYSQYIEGNVLDAETHKPIEGVHVFADNIVDGTMSISNGSYFLKFQNPKAIPGNIYFSHIGYKKITIAFKKNQKKYTVYLVKKVNTLGEISITEKRNLNQTISYKKLKSMKSGLFSFGAVLNKDKIHVVGGNASYQIDGPKRALEKYANTDLTLIEILQKSQGSYFKDIYKGDFLTYDIPTDTWTKNETKFDKRAFHNANLFGENLYVLGGTTMSVSKKKEYLKTNIEIINLQTNTKIVDGTNPHQAVNFVSFNYQGNLIVAGGSIKKK